MDDQSAASTPAPGDVSARVFRVIFSPNIHSYGAGHGPARLRERGRVYLEAGRVVFEGSKGRFSRTKTFSLTSADVFDVAGVGKTVTLRCRVDSGSIQAVRMRLSSAAEAQQLSAQLPAHKTEQFLTLAAERGDFNTRLAAFGGRSLSVYAIIAINIAVYVLMCANGVQPFEPSSASLIAWGADYGPLTTNGEWWRMVTSTFVHIGLVHIALNMWVFYATGRLVERLFGSARFICLYVVSGIVASAASLLWHPQAVSAGASGAIFGVFGGLLVFVLNKRNAVPQSVMLEHRNSAAILVLFNLFNGFVHNGTDNAAHIGGLVAGMATGFFLARPLTQEARNTSRPDDWLLASGVGLALLLGVLWPVVHPSDRTLRERDFAQVRTHLGRDEQVALNAVKRVMQNQAAGRLEGVQLSVAISEDIYPKWDGLYREVAATGLQPDDPSYRLYCALLHYLDARREQYKLAALAVLTNDAALNAKALAQRHVTDQALNELKAAQNQ